MDDRSTTGRDGMTTVHRGHAEAVTDHLREPRFGEGEPFALGVEEELFLTDPADGRLLNERERVLDAVGEPVRGEITGEVHACQVELITDVCATAGEAAGVLADLRRAVLGTGVGIVGTGTHPTAEEQAAEISDRRRYRFIAEQLGDALITPVAGVHVHVGMPDADTAIRVFNGLRGHLPLIEALSANSPFRHGRDTGLASAREVAMRGWPRSGVPRAMRDFEDFCASSALLASAADVPDYTWFWWKLRPHPRLGTVEVRALDAQTSLDDAAALVALTHCLARHAALAPPQPDPPSEILDEGAFRAARFGVDAELPGADGSRRPVPVLLEEVLGAVADDARELGCEAELDATRKLLERGGGAGQQREQHAIGGLGALLRDAVARTSGA
jgi:carboxylate-amine ligase